jgi:hypothetical protein
MADTSAEPIRYFMLSEDDDADDGSGQEGRSGGAGRMCLVEIRCYPKLGLAADGHARWVLERTVVPVPSSSDVSRALGDAVDNYVATKISDPAFAFSDTWWIVSDPGGLGAGAEAVNRAQKGLHQLLLGDPAQAVCQALGGPMPGMVGGIAAELPLPIDRPLGFIQELLEVGGMAVGIFAGMPLLTTASCKSFLHDQLTHSVARGIGAATQELLAPAPGPPDAGSLPPADGSGGLFQRRTHPAGETSAGAQRPWRRSGRERRVVGGNDPQSQTSPDDVTKRAIERNRPARGQGPGTNRGGAATSR